MNVQLSIPFKGWKFVLSFFIATLLFLILDYFLPLPTWKYRITHELNHRIPNGYVFMHDFDHDGISEYVFYKKEQISEKYAIKVEKYSGRVVEQWNLTEKYLDVYPIYGDYDHDLWDEIYFFTQNGDSLFLWGIDIRNTSGFTINRECIYAAPLPAGVQDRDMYAILGSFLDCDDDGYDDLILSFYAAFALQPRGFLTYSIHKRKILNENTGIGPAGLGRVMVYLPPSGKRADAVLYPMSNFAANNYSRDVPLRDDKTWFFAMDRELRFLFPPIPFSPQYSSLVTELAHFDGTPYFVVMHYSRSTYKKPAVLYLYTLHGQEVTRRYLSDAYLSAHIFVIPSGMNDKLYLSLPDGTLELLNKNLQPITRKKLPSTLNRLNFSADLDGDNSWEYCFWSGERIIITDSRLNILAGCSFEEPVKGMYVAPAYLPDGSGNMYFTNGEEGIKLKFEKNRFGGFFTIAKVALFALLLYLTMLLVNAGYRHNMLYAGYNRYSDVSEQGLLLLDENGRILKLNEKASQLLGQDPEQLLGIPLEKALPDQPQLTTFWRKLRIGVKTLEEDAKLAAGDGIRNVHLKGLTLKNWMGFKMGFFICMIDLSQSGLSERLQFWGETVQKMAHDIKTPLSSLQLNLQTINYKINDRDPEMARQVKEEFQMIFSELHRVREMTRSFIKFVKMEEPSRKMVLLPELAQKALAHFQHLSDIGQLVIETDFDPEGLYLYVDPQQMEMVFQILLENAVEAMQAKGRILISSAVCQSVAAGLTDMLEIDFVDDGPGMDSATAAQIFEPFYTTKKTGNGMGLPIAKKIIQEHGGHLELVTSEKRKTVFRITLPLGRFSLPEQDVAASET